MNNLEKLLYRKKSTEKLLEIWSKGIKIYTGFVDTCEAVIKDKERSEEEKSEIRVKLHEARVPLNHYITSFKSARREYDHHIIPEIEKLTTEEEREGIEFQDLEAKSEELAKSEIFATHDKQPDNVELIQVNESLKSHIELLESLVTASVEKAATTEDSYEKAKLNLDVFKYQLHIITNKKRLEEREDYYVNQFKPAYDKEMEEADQYLEALIERANEIVKLGVDVKLTFLLQEYEKNKDDKEKVWLFYTTLKSRLRKIGKAMRKDKSGTFKGKMHLAKDII